MNELRSHTGGADTVTALSQMSTKTDTVGSGMMGQEPEQVLKPASVMDR